jgi:hypothetical protein
LLFAVLGMAGQSIIQNGLLGVGNLTQDELLLMLDKSDQAAMAAVAVVLQFVLAGAVPVFAFLLADGFTYTSSAKNYFLRVAGVAVLSEIPFTLAMSGKWLDLNSRNPVFGMVLALVVLYFFRYYGGKSLKNVLVKLLVVAIAILWVEMLHIQDGAAIVVIAASMYALRGKRSLQVLGGCVVMFLCTAFSIFYLAAPITFLVVHFYNDEPGAGNKVINYLAYPVLLLVIGLVGVYAF